MKNISGSAKRASLILACALIVVGSRAEARWFWEQEDYESCTESAAKEAKSKAGLDVLLNLCAQRFVGRRKRGTSGYTFYDVRQNRSFDIAGPNPTAAEKEMIDNANVIHQKELQETQEAFWKQELEKEKERAALEAQQKQEAEEAKFRKALADFALGGREANAARRIRIVDVKIECPNEICVLYQWIVKVQNQSSETIKSISFSWFFLPTGETVCPPIYTASGGAREEVDIPPGKVAMLKIETSIRLGSTEPKGLSCFRVTRVTVAP
jgi:hypothetical protein